MSQTEVGMSKRPAGTERAGHQKARAGEAQDQELIRGQARVPLVPCSATPAPQARTRERASWWTLWWKIERLRRKTELRYSGSLVQRMLNLKPGDIRKFKPLAER